MSVKQGKNHKKNQEKNHKKNHKKNQEKDTYNITVYPIPFKDKEERAFALRSFLTAFKQFNVEDCYYNVGKYTIVIKIFGRAKEVYIEILDYEEMKDILFTLIDALNIVQNKDLRKFSKYNAYIEEQSIIKKGKRRK
jgi:hypothetical protein